VLGWLGRAIQEPGSLVVVLDPYIEQQIEKGQIGAVGGQEWVDERSFV